MFVSAFTGGQTGKCSAANMHKKARPLLAGLFQKATVRRTLEVHVATRIGIANPSIVSDGRLMDFLEVHVAHAAHATWHAARCAAA
jgi:hypothetical protein